MKQNINPYNSEQFKKHFESTDICRNIANDFEELWWNQKINLFNSMTTRQLVSCKGGFSMIPFYYLQPLLEKNPTSIYDLGCGANMFKKYIPNIIGVDRSGGKICLADIEDRVDAEYVKNHQNYFESVFSINALHFRPLYELRSVYEEFISMVAPGGRGFLCVNIQRMIERQPNIVARSDKTGKKIYEQYVRTQLDNLPCTYLIFDVNLNPLDEYIDGNIRLVFER